MRIIMMGTGPFAVPTFHALLDSEHEVPLLVTRPSPPARGRRKPPPNPMRDAAEERGVPVWAPESINDPDAVQKLFEYDADLLVVCDYGQILSKDALRSAKLGGINLHGSLLPKYRGAAPVNWAIYNGDPESGVTVIHMTPKLDGGPCLTKSITPIEDDDDAVTLEEKLSLSGVQPVLDAISMLADWDGESPIGEIQDQSQATKAPRLSKSDGQVDWTQSAAQIALQVRAFQPWPASYTHFERESGEPIRVILNRVSVVPDAQASGAPGTISFHDKKTLNVSTGDGVLSLDVIQPAGKRSMEVSEFLRGHSIKAGDQFQ